MERTTPSGCHKPPASPPRPTAREGDDRQPDLLTYLTARVRFWIVCSWIPQELDEVA